MFNLVYRTQEDEQNRIAELVKNLDENDKTNFIFNGEFLYYLTHGHDFVYSFFTQYITKSRVVITYYISGDYWRCGRNVYKYRDDKFVEISDSEYPTYTNSGSFESIRYPIIKRISYKSLADEIISVKPI